MGKSINPMRRGLVGSCEPRSVTKPHRIDRFAYALENSFCSPMFPHFHIEGKNNMLKNQGL